MKKLLTFLLFSLSISSFSQNIAAGWAFSLSLCNTTTNVHSCGYNYYGVIGDGTSSDSDVPVLINTLTNVSAVSARQFHALALKNDGTIWAWGSGFSGDGTNVERHVPVQVSSLMGIRAISAGGFHSLALKNDGTVWAWGQGYTGQLGNGLNTDTSLAVNINSLNGSIAIAGGGSHSLVLKNDSTVWVFGYNGKGQLGIGSNTDTNVPVQISSLSGVAGIAGGYFHSLILKSDGTVWAFGDNQYGQLGNGTTTDSNIPVQVSALSDIIAISGGQNHSMALKSDGTVWTWGANSAGQLGDGTSSDHLVPNQVTSLNGITEIAAGNWHCVALKNDGTIWGWGINDYGELGTGNTIISRIPIQMIGGACANCFAHYSTTYNAALNNFTITVDSTTGAEAIGYSWDFGDGSSSTAGLPTHTYAVDSIYNVCMKIYTSAGDSCTYCHFIGKDSLGNVVRNGGFTINVENPYITATQVIELNQSPGMVIYPNPFTIQTTIGFSELQKNSLVQIMDVYGVKIKEFRFSGKELTLEKGAMKEGIYLISVTNEKGKVLKKKMIVQ